MKNVVGMLSLSSVLFLSSVSSRVSAEPLSTDRHVHGVITVIDTAALSIASSQRTVSGKIDPERTKVKINGKAAKLADLKVTTHAKAELCLDDVWLVIDAHESH